MGSKLIEAFKISHFWDPDDPVEESGQKSKNEKKGKPAKSKTKVLPRKRAGLKTA